MGFPKPVPFFIGGSLFLHGLFISSFYVATNIYPTDTENVAMISTVEYSPKILETPAAGARPSHTSPFPVQRQHVTGVRESSDFLMDPKNGKIFVDYFMKIKEKITRTIQKRYAIENGVKGSVELLFVLNSHGRLENAWVSKEKTDADEAARTFALECLKAAAPFNPFPKELGSEKISFNVAVFF